MGIFSRLKIGAKSAWTNVQFWEWFQSADGQQTLAAIAPRQGDSSPSAQAALRDALQKVHSDLVWGINPSKEEGSRSAFEIGAGGLKAMIPIVKSLVEAAPVMSNWDIVAFKQPIKGFSISTGSIERVDEQTVLVHSKPCEDGRFDLDVYLPTPAGFPARGIAELGFIALDHALGEYAVMSRIAEVHFDSTLVAPPGSISIGEFAAALEA